ncbi:MAG: pentapeptide repeat-containing protein [Acidobacteria bacterium]|nr:pentapeptide repeat-containing protein [Acidobacteriota bacterium]
MVALQAVGIPGIPRKGLDPGSLAEREWLLNYLGGLCDAVEDHEVVLIIDQLEELMGSGTTGYSRRPGDLALQLIGTTFLEEKRLRLLLSLREEYAARLRPLDILVGSIRPRTYLLSPMQVGAFRETVMLTSKALNKAAVNCVLQWAVGSKTLDNSSPVDTLVAQSILKDVYLWRAKQPRNRTSTSMVRYKSKLNALWKAEPYFGESSIGRIAEGAMFRHIDRVLRPAANEVEAVGVSDGLVKRVAARMGSILSGPRGFKRHITDLRLVMEAVKEDLRTPPMTGLAIREVYSLYEKLRRRTRKNKTPRSTMVPSDSSPKAKAEVLGRAAFVALGRLEFGNVLKCHGVDERGNRVLALQHDGFGPALDRWGEMARSGIEDAFWSVVGCYGHPIRDGIVGKPKDHAVEKEEVKDLVWKACFLENVNFHNVRFLKCDFAGSWIEDCDFIHCEFVECKLPAVGFRGCTVSETEFRRCELQSVAFMASRWKNVSLVDKCDARGMLVKDGCEWSGKIEFENAALTSATIEDLKLKGHLRMTGCTLCYAQLKHFDAADLEEVEIENCGLHGALVADYDNIPARNRRKNKQVDDKSITTGPSDV